MSARIVSSLTDERADMRKQVGCMTGIFQLLDRHHFLIGRRIGAHSNKKLLTKGGHHNMEPRSVTKTNKEKSVQEGLKGKQMVSDQSSKIYPSSPTSSNLSSSLGRYRTPQLESPSCSQTDFPKTPKKQHSSSLHLGRQSPDIQDVVKESMHREARSVSIKAVAKVEGKIHLLKHIDSPRPLKQPELDDKDNVLQRAARNPPRFSCDGMESRERLKATMKLGDTPRLSLDSGLRSIKSSADQESGCYKRSSSVVAKLMGLEGFPDSVSIIHHSFFPDEYSISMSSTQTQHPNLQFRPATSTSNSRLPLELAPWCQPDSNQIKMRKSKVPSTVFGEIEKRVTELEFKKSGKDLRALKQILEAMHRTSPRLECQKQEHNHPCSTKWETYLTKKFNSSIPIPKQDSHNGNTKVAGSIDKGRAKLAPKRNNVVKEPSRGAEKKNNGRTSKSVQDHNHIQVRSPGAVSPRLQDKKQQGKDKQPNIPPSDSSRLRRHQNKQQPKPGPPQRRHKPKPNNLQYDDDQTSETSSDTRNPSEKGNNTASVQSERNDCLVSVGNDTTMTEQPSPVSVLDAAFYIEDSPSPVKKISSAFRDYEPADANETEWHLDCTRILGSEYNLVHKLSILNTDPDPDHEHSINQIASLCPSENFDHHYINKVILASGILKDLGCVSTTELHPSGNLINPELFHVLEQTERPTDKNPLQFDQKIHRKLIFDTVNEILSHKKLHLKGSKRRCLSGQQLLKELYAEIEYLQPKPNSRLGIEDDEIVSILTADMKHEWGGDDSEIPALALSIERLIFKDLITEVIRGDGEERSRGHCRQLFTH
ncbi:protein LONGIFOLIA 1-like [Ipomoea triloba]|uniref:protein LONGIFOLIA 1-like n=1 Tax=Ipomoea triloba TaxID=35885 RepID=UPI00125DB91A|nr:protein LONGIFOLIA 1-like [Ipomoea triloba]